MKYITKMSVSVTLASLIIISLFVYLLVQIKTLSVQIKTLGTDTTNLKSNEQVMASVVNNQGDILKQIANYLAPQKK